MIHFFFIYSISGRGDYILCHTLAFYNADCNDKQELHFCFKKNSLQFNLLGHFLKSQVCGVDIISSSSGNFGSSSTLESAKQHQHLLSVW